MYPQKAKSNVKYPDLSLYVSILLFFRLYFEHCGTGSITRFQLLVGALRIAQRQGLMDTDLDLSATHDIEQPFGAFIEQFPGCDMRRQGRASHVE